MAESGDSSEEVKWANGPGMYFSSIPPEERNELSIEQLKKEKLSIENTFIVSIKSRNADLDQKVTFRRFKDANHPIKSYNDRLEETVMNVVQQEQAKENTDVSHELTNRLNEEAQTKLNKGPTKVDGPAKVYMYRLKASEYESSDCTATNHYKIGKSVDPKARVARQAAKNKESYEIVFSTDTIYATLSEQIVFKQLKEFHAPRPKGDGKREWYKGTQTDFIETIKMVVYLVTIRYTDKFMLDNICSLFKNFAVRQKTRDELT